MDKTEYELLPGIYLSIILSMLWWLDFLAVESYKIYDILLYNVVNFYSSDN